MRAGLLKYSIVINKPVYVKNEFGQKKETFEFSYKTKARVLNTGGSRYNDGTQEVVYDYNKSFVVRDYVPVGEYDRILFKDKQYRIISIDENPDDRSKTINTKLIND